MKGAVQGNWNVPRLEGQVQVHNYLAHGVIWGWGPLPALGDSGVSEGSWPWAGVYCEAPGWRSNCCHPPGLRRGLTLSLTLCCHLARGTHLRGNALRSLPEEVSPGMCSEGPGYMCDTWVLLRKPRGAWRNSVFGIWAPLPIPALPFVSCMTLGKSLLISDSLFSG